MPKLAFPLSNVRVWRLYQARCLYCHWSGEIWGYPDRHCAEDEKRAHVAAHRRFLGGSDA